MNGVIILLTAGAVGSPARPLGPERVWRACGQRVRPAAARGIRGISLPAEMLRPQLPLVQVLLVFAQNRP